MSNKDKKDLQNQESNVVPKIESKSKIDLGEPFNADAASNISNKNIQQIVEEKTEPKAQPQTIKIRTDQVELLMKHFEISKNQAEKILIRFLGDVYEAGKYLLTV